MNPVRNYKIKYLVIIFLIGFLLVPKPAFAFVGWLQNIFDQILQGIEEVSKPMMKFMIGAIIAYVAGIGALALTSHYLQVFINSQSAWLSQISQATEAGFSFTLGLANLFLVLILLVIAFAFIFELETFQAKKALPRLFIIALLINFSLLFVKMLVDAGNIVFNTILPADTNLFTTAMSPFLTTAADIIKNALIWVGAIAASWAIPYANAAAQVIFVGLFAGVLLPNIIVWIFQTICFFALAGMFAAFVFLFGARVFIIQICAILAPLAFLCLILPKTKKYFDMWLKMLVGWIFLGIFCLFFLVLGFRIVGLLAPPAGPVPIPVLSWLSFGQYISYYFAIFIYMGIILWLSKRMLPTGAQSLIDFGKQIGGLIVTRGLKPLGRAVGKQAGQGMVELTQIEAEREKRAREEARARGVEYKPSRRQIAARLARGGAMAWVVRRGYGAVGKTPELEMAKDIEERLAAYKKRFGKDTKSAMAVFPRWKIADPHSKIAQALYLAKMEGAEGINRLSKEQQYEVLERMKTSVPHKLVDIIKHKPELITEKEARITDYGEAQKRKDEVMLMAMREYDRAMKEYDRAEKEGNKEAMKDLKAVMKDLEEKAVGKRERSVPTIRRTMVPKGMEDKDVQRLVEAKIDYNEEIEKVMKETGLGKEAARQAVLITKAAFKKAADALKDADIENLAAASFENPEFQEAIVRFKPTHFIQKVGEEKGQEYIDLIHNKFEEMAAKEEGIEEIVKTNKILLQQSITNPAFRSVFPAPRGIRELKTMDEKLGRIEKTATKVAEKEKPKSTIVTLPPEGPRVSEERLKTAKEEREKLEELRRKKKEGEKTEE